MRTHVYVPGLGVVTKAKAEEARVASSLPAVAEIIRNHSARGLQGYELYKAVARHARVIASCDREVALGLAEYVERHGCNP